MAMVKEIRYIFRVDDIKAIRLKCGNCQAEVLLSPTSTQSVSRCPECATSWVRPGNISDLNTMMLGATRAIVENPPSAMTIHLEFEGDSDA